MSKRPSLFGSRPAPAEAAHVPVVKDKPPVEAVSTRKHPVAKSREGKRNATAYLDPEAFKQLKIIAAREDVTVQDLFVEGINEVFAKRGLSRIA